jgi:para-nitrobenzyl esterase
MAPCQAQPPSPLTVIAAASVTLPRSFRKPVHHVNASAHQVRVDAPAGRVRGTAEGDLRVFRGIPYAQPPVGSLRWRPPLPLARWTGMREATEFGAACYQPPPRLSSIYVGKPMPMSEDCLTLNIWAPPSQEGAGLFS